MFDQRHWVKEELSITDKVHNKFVLGLFSTWLCLHSLVHEYCSIGSLEIPVFGKVLKPSAQMSYRNFFFLEI